MIIIGLTGSIGMGKSTAAKLFSDLGVPIFDADNAVHKMLGVGGILVKKVGDAFPSSVQLKNNKRFIDRNILGNLIFKDKKKKNILEKIIHPEVGRSRKKWKEFAQREGFQAVCYDIPLLFETKGHKSCNYIVVVSAPFYIQKQRVLKRLNMTEKKFYNILNNQLSDYEKRKKADFVINTGNGHRFSRNQVKLIVNKILK
tara:strand:- start:26805 stop:27404 length:600 start_codon:yes stop_codon:yes gene_type:complete